MKPSSLSRKLGWVLAAVFVTQAAHAEPGTGNEESLPPHLSDRGTGVPISSIGTYVRDGEWLVMPSFTYYSDSDIQYDPNEFGYPSPTEFSGQYRANEASVLVAYGLSDRIALELKAAATDASLEKASADLSGMPAEVQESGLGDAKVRLDWRWLTESGNRPEMFSFVEVFFPHDEDKILVGTPDWVSQVGIGAVRGFNWGTVTFRAAMLYELASSSKTDWGEVSVEYLKRLSPKFSVVGALAMNEGDEGTLITELQWRVTPSVVIKFNNGLGFTSAGMDWVPQIGVLFSFPED